MLFQGRLQGYVEYHSKPKNGGIFQSCIKLQRSDRKSDRKLVTNQFYIEIFVSKFKNFLENFKS